MAHDISVCLDLLFREFGEPMSAKQLRAVKAAGFNKVEFWSWRNRDLEATARVLAKLELSAVAMVSSPQGSLVDPSLREAFMNGLRESLPVAQRLGIPNLVVVSGPARAGISDPEQAEAMIRTLRLAAPLAEDHGVTLALEPWNTRIDHPGTFLHSTELALDIVEQVNSPAVRILYDLYHSIVMGEDPRAVLKGRTHLVAHVQVADHPGRHEPGSGNIAWETSLRALADAGYSGSIGLEYIPTDAGTLRSLTYIRNILRRP